MRQDILISGSEVDVPLEVLAQRLHDGLADAFVATRYHGDLAGHLWLKLTRGNV